MGQSEFKIEKGVPIPKKGREKKVWPFDEMAVGDSFFVTADLHGRAQTAASWYSRRDRKKFTVRKVDGGYRVWRTR